MHLPDELMMLVVSFLPIRYIISRLPLVSRYFNDVVVWGKWSGALMWREMAIDARVFKWFSDYDNHPSQTALIRACMRDAPLAHVSSLIAGGANVNAVDLANNDGWTALMWASNYNYVDVVRVLVNARADVNLKNNAGRTALKMARNRGHHDIIRLLESSSEH
jgi:hypothetical protein